MVDPAALRKVLLVEDDPIVRRLTVTLLTSAGFAVVAVGNGKVALERCGGEAFDLILSDATMPQLGGVELLRQLRAQGVTTPFVLMSGYTDGRSESDAPEASAHLGKPFGSGALLASIEAAFAAHR